MRVAAWAFLGALAASGAHAAPMCMPDSLANYELLAPGASGGCTVGPLDFHDFAFFVQASSGGATPVSDSNITVTPVMGPDRFGLTYSSNGFSVTSGQSIQYLLTYTIDPPPPIIHGFDVSFDVDGPTAPGLDTTTSVECLDAAFTGTTCPTSTVTQTVFDNGITSSRDSTVALPGFFTTLGDRTTITLDASMGGTANFTSLTESAITPEPATGVLAGTLILVLLVFQRRLKARQIGFKLGAIGGTSARR
jgi:hypothetical protein